MSHTAPHNAHPRYRPDIDGLRAVSILAVILTHAFPNTPHGGFIGVDVFFVISGFLISSIIFRSMEKGAFSYIEFYEHRIKRIFPALIVVLVACFAFGWFALLPDEYAQLGKHIAAGAGFVQNFVLWKEAGYFDTNSELKPLLHLWSLAVEEQYYIVYPLLMWLVWRSRKAVLALLIVLTLTSFVLNIIGIHKDITGTYYLPQTRFWELMAGCLLAYIQLFHPPQLSMRWRQGLSILGFVLVLASIFGINNRMLFPGWWALGPVAGAWLLIFAGPDTWVNKKILSNKPMVWIGLISYPLYLWHWPLLSFAHILNAGEMPSLTIRWIAIALSFALAWLTYQFVEKPIRFGGKKK